MNRSMKRKTTPSLLILLCALTQAAWATTPIGLNVSGVPDGMAPEIAQRLHSALLYAADRPVVTGPAVREWFWQEDVPDRQIRVVFSRYYSGQDQKTVLPLVAARYSYLMHAEGTSAVYSSTGDSLLFRTPFTFHFERPVIYQVAGIRSDLPSAQIGARSHVLLETEALDSLSRHLVLLLESGAPSQPGAR